MHQSSTWKLFTLVGIIAIGCMVILQVQKGLPVNQGAADGSLADLSDSKDKFDFDFGENIGMESDNTSRSTKHASGDSANSNSDEIFSPGEQREPDSVAVAPRDNGFGFGDPPSNDTSGYFDDDAGFGDDPAPTPIQQAGYSEGRTNGFSDAPGQVSLGSVDDEIVFDDDEPVVSSYGDAPRFAETDPAPEPTRKTQPMYFGANERASTGADSNPNPIPVEDAFGDVGDVFPGEEEFAPDEKDAFGGTNENEFGAFDDAPPSRDSFSDNIPLETPDGGAFDDRFLESPAASRPQTDPSVTIDLQNAPTETPGRLRNGFDDTPTANRRSQPANFQQDANTVISRTTADARQTSTPPPKRSNIRQAQLTSEPSRSNLVGSGTVSGDVASGSQRPQLQINKVMPKNAVLGKPLIYQIIVTNIGNARARQVVVEDQVPRGCELHGTIPQAKLGRDQKDRLVWNLGVLNPHEERKISVRIVPIAEGQIGSVATVNFAADVASQTTITAPKINIHLVGPKEVMIGDPVVYKYRLTNQGSGEASNVVIRSLIPEGLEHPDGNDLEYSVGTLQPGKSKDVVLKLAAVKSGDLINSAVVTADGGIQKEIRAPVTVIGQQLVLTRRGPARRYIGRDGTYQNIVRNESRRPAVDAVVIERIPAGMKYISSNAGGQYDESRRSVAWRIARLESGQTQTLEVTLRPTDSGEQVSLVQVMELTGLKSQAETKTNVEHLMTMGLDISEVDGPVAVGEKMQFTIRVRNRGTASTRNVKLALDVPAELKVISAGPAKAIPVRNTAQGQLIEFAALPSIPAGEFKDYTVTVQAMQLAQGQSDDDVRLRATVQSDEMPKPLPQERAIRIYTDR